MPAVRPKRFAITTPSPAPRAPKDARMFDALGVAVCLADARDPDHPLVYVNAAFEELTGWSAGEVLGRNCSFLQGHDTEGPALEELRSALADGRQCRVTLRNHRRSGEAFWNELTLTPMPAGANPPAYFAAPRATSTWPERSSCCSSPTRPWACSTVTGASCSATSAGT
jgi:PAS domain S-box-containing protein